LPANNLQESHGMKPKNIVFISCKSFLIPNKQHKNQWR